MFSNFLARTISVSLHSVTKCHSVRFSLLAYLRNAKPILSLRRLSRLISLPRKNVKLILVRLCIKFSRISATEVEAV